jgi:hypothetical protein
MTIQRVAINQEDAKRMAQALRASGWQWNSRTRKWTNRQRGICQPVAMPYKEATWFVYHTYEKGGAT